jgi:hypothetical protein
MKDILSTKFVEYLRENNPDILFSLQDGGSLTGYINQKITSIDGLLEQLQQQSRPEYIIEELCMEAITAELKPSKYLYIKEILEEEFRKEYHHLRGLGILRFEIINLTIACNPLFEVFGFSEQNEEDENLRYTIIGTIREYFEWSESENRVSWPTMPTINF